MHFNETPSPTLCSPDQVLAHPAFAEARAVWIEAMLSLYENNPPLSRLLTSTVRSTVFFNLLVLHADFSPTDRATWPTMRLLQESLAPYQMSSRRRIEAIVNRFVETGYVVRRTPPLDQRVRLLAPTEKMVEHDLDWLRAYFSPLAQMFPACGYTMPMRRDRDFRTVLRRIVRRAPGDSVKLLEGNPTITMMMNRDAGMMVLMKLIQAGAAAGPSRIGLSDIADRFGISRTHVRRLLQDADREGLLRLSDSGITLDRKLVASFDRFLADCMSAFDVLYQVALASPELTQSRVS